MERRRHTRRNEVEAQLRELARRGKPGALMGPLFDLSEELVQGGYPRDLLYEDLKQLLRELRAAGGQDYEDDILEVMDVLTGWCAPSARL